MQDRNAYKAPAVFENGTMRYENTQHGTLESFYGTENIFEKGEKVYFLHYHGGEVAVPRVLDEA
jgi:hypothetical protein